MFNSLKSAFAVLLLAGMSTTAFAGIGGKVGVASDNYFRGHNISDGIGYKISGNVDWNGLYGSVGLMSLADDFDGDHLMISKLGYGMKLAGMKVKLSYNDYRHQGGDHDGWKEFGVAMDLYKFGFKYHKGLDGAGDFYAIHSDILKVARLEYGDWDDGGSYWKIHKGFDLLKGKLHVGYIDHEDNEDDFADKIKDLDNFYVGYSYKF